MENRKLIKNVDGLYSYNSRETYFVNDFGIIYGNKVELFKLDSKKIVLNDIAFVRLINLPKRLSVWVLVITLIISSGLYFLEAFNPIFIIFFQVFVMIWYYTYKKNQFSIQIVLCIAKQVFIPVSKHETVQAKKFVNKLLQYKQDKPELNILR